MSVSLKYLNFICPAKGVHPYLLLYLNSRYKNLLTQTMQYTMNTAQCINKILLFIALITCVNLHGQDTKYINWKNYSDSTFVFEINNKEAEKFLKDGGSKVLMDKILHTHIATFSGKWENAPRQGHFIFVNINQNKIDYRYAPIMPFQVFLFKEYGLLTLQVIDAEGEVRDDAKVKIQSGIWRIFDPQISFDKTSKTYTIDDWSEKTNRILTIELDKFKAVFDLNKHLVQPYYGRNYDGSSSGPEFYSYMLTDKNKYKPHEKVRFKSYALTGSKKAIKKDLEVWLQNVNYSYKKITTISPYNPGGFAGEIELHDSLKLRLDRDYYLQLRDNKGRIVAGTSFRYEDYELYDNKLETKLKSGIHYYPDTNHIEIKVTDANGLIIPDIKSTVTIRRGNIYRSYVDLLLAPYIIKKDTLTLDNNKPTIYNIPPSLFEKTDCSYYVDIEVLTHDGQLMKASHNVTFYKSYYEIRYKTEGSTILFDFYELGKEKKAEAELYIDDSEKPVKIHLPHREEFKQSVKTYRIRVPQYNAHQNVSTSSLYHGLNIEGGLVKDSIKLKLINPLELDVSWYVYEGNMILEKGSGKEFSFEKAYVNLDITYYLEIFYTIGGADHVYRKIYAPKKEYLNIDLDMPDRIYPGQTISSKIKVTDSRGDGVNNVDITAFSFNSLLGYYVPDLPYYGATPKAREQRDSYSIHKRNVNYSSLLTRDNYEFWNKIMGLDKMKYYQFAFPDPELTIKTDKVFSASYTDSIAPIPYHDIFKYTVNTPDSTTEFAPYVMKDGKSVKIYAIELDDKPIYFSWTEQPKGYSFLANDYNYHKIMLRLHDRAIIIDNYCFDKGRKTVFSLDLDSMPKSRHIRAIMLNTRDNQGRYSFTNEEKSRYKKYISEVPVASNRYTYMKNEDKKLTFRYPVFHPRLKKHKEKLLVGPLDEGYYKYMDGVRYLHEGGFSYKYADNVIYKYPHNPFIYLYFASDNNFERLNDFCYTDKEFDRLIGMTVTPENKWFPQVINLSNTKIHVPNDKDATGIHSLIMRNKATGKLFIPAYKRNIMTRSSSSDNLFGIKDMKPGAYDVFLLYNSGKYLRRDSVPFFIENYTELKMDNCIEHPKDSVSTKWLKYEVYSSPTSQSYNSDQSGNRNSGSWTYTQRTHFNPANDIRGTVKDRDGEPLIGVSVHIKNTQIGTMTDFDGNFVLDLHGPGNTLVFSYIGFKSTEIEATRGGTIAVTLEEDMQMLDEVVTVAYGSVKKMMMTGSVSSVSGSGVSAGSMPEEKLDETDDDDNDSSAEDKLYAELMTLNGMRTNFSDVGFWEPTLVTNRKGEAEFSVTFPDNITQWNAVVYAMNRKLKTGTLRKNIRSYKPLMAELKTPQFLVVGDSSNFSASIRNYTKDKEIHGNVDVVYNNDTIASKMVHLENSFTENVRIMANEADSLSVSYRFTRNDGYSDGEQRSIPIEKQGTEVAEGTLQFLRNGDEINIEAQPDENVHISITGKQLDVYMDATYYLTGYKYACNEQLASKLIGLLNYKLVKQFNGEEFKNDKEIHEIIKRLLDNQNQARLWSWWGNQSGTSFWMSAHILRALSMAKKAGYPVGLETGEIYDYIDIHTFRGSSLYDIDILNTLIDLKMEQSYPDAITMFENKIAKIEAYEDSLVSIYKKTKDPLKYFRKNSYLRDKLLLQEMRQKLGMEYDRSMITNNIKTDVFGSVRMVDSIQNRYWYYNNDALNIIAYRIVRNDSSLMHYKDAIQMHILGSKKYGWNTFQASSAVAAILPDLLAESATKDNMATIHLIGKENATLSKFPYETILKDGEKLNIKKESGIPLIYSAYTMKYRKEEHFGDAFEVKTWLSADKLSKGTPVRMEIEVKVKQENAEHVMIEIPIPAGCSYQSKDRAYGSNEVYREYFKEKTVIFCEKLPEGTYRYYVNLLPRFSGNYILNPAKVEMMYFPVVNSNNELRKIDIAE